MQLHAPWMQPIELMKNKISDSFSMLIALSFMALMKASTFSVPYNFMKI